MSCSFVFILRVCERLLPTVWFLVLLCPSSRSKGLRFRPLLLTTNQALPISPSIHQLTQSSVAEYVGALTDNLTQVIEDRLGGFARRCLEENGSTVEQGGKRAVEKVIPVGER